MTFYDKMRIVCLAIPEGKVATYGQIAMLCGAIHFHIPGLQKTLLEEDGVAVFWNGNNWCVDLKQYGWMTTVEDVAYFAEKFGQAEDAVI